MGIEISKPPSQDKNKPQTQVASNNDENRRRTESKIHNTSSNNTRLDEDLGILSRTTSELYTDLINIWNSFGNRNRVAPLPALIPETLRQPSVAGPSRNIPPHYFQPNNPATLKERDNELTAIVPEPEYESESEPPRQTTVRKSEFVNQTVVHKPEIPSQITVLEPEPDAIQRQESLPTFIHESEESIATLDTLVTEVESTDKKKSVYSKKTSGPLFATPFSAKREALKRFLGLLQIVRSHKEHVDDDMFNDEFPCRDRAIADRDCAEYLVPFFFMLSSALMGVAGYVYYRLKPSFVRTILLEEIYFPKRYYGILTYWEYYGAAVIISIFSAIFTIFPKYQSWHLGRFVRWSIYIIPLIYMTIIFGLMFLDLPAISNHIEVKIKKRMHEEFNKKGKHFEVTNWSDTQSTFRCCGFHSTADWINRTKVLGPAYEGFDYDRSCCDYTKEDCINKYQTKQTWTKGCTDIQIKTAKDILKANVVIGCLTEIFGIWLLYKLIRIEINIACIPSFPDRDQYGFYLWTKQADVIAPKPVDFDAVST